MDTIEIAELSQMNAGSVIAWELPGEQALYADIKTASGWLRTSSATLADYQNRGFAAHLLYAAP